MVLCKKERKSSVLNAEERMRLDHYADRLQFSVELTMGFQLIELFCTWFNGDSNKKYTN